MPALSAAERLIHSLAQVSSVEEIFDVALEGLRDSLGVSRSSILVFDEQGAMRIRGSKNLSEDYRKAVDGINPWETVSGDPQPMLNPDVLHDPFFQGNVARLFEKEGIRAMAVIPLVARRRLLGRFTLYYDAPHSFEENEVTLARFVANLVAFALDQKRMEEAMRLQQQSSALLNESLDYNETLNQLLKLAVPRLGDYVSVVLRMPDGRLKRVAWHYLDDRFKAFAENRSPLRADAPRGPAAVVRTGQAELVSVTDASLLQVLPGSDSMRSLVFLPLRSSNQIIGALALASGQPGRYTEADLPLLEELAHHAAVALSNAKLHSDLQEGARSLAQANQAKDEFLGLVSHELRTPITVVLGNSHHLLRKGLDLREPERSALEDIYVEAERLSRIIENLLVLARLDQGQEIEKGPVHIERVVELVCKAFKQSNPEREIVVTCCENIPYALGFQLYVEQILRNLLSNAIKYSPAHEPIDLNISRDDSTVEVLVRDRGRPISLEERESIFQPFYRTADQEHAHKQGVGIGLSVCQRLVDAMGGVIWVEAAESGGNVFAFKLPVYDELPV